MSVECQPRCRSSIGQDVGRVSAEKLGGGRDVGRVSAEMSVEMSVERLAEMSLEMFVEY